MSPSEDARAVARRIVAEVLAAHDAQQVRAPAAADAPAVEVEPPAEEEVVAAADAAGPPPLPAAALAPSSPATPEPEVAPPRHGGRWLVATLIGAIALAVLLPLVVAAFRGLVGLS